MMLQVTNVPVLTQNMYMWLDTSYSFVNTSADMELTLQYR